MDKEEKKKKRNQGFGATIGNIVKIAKYIANPAIVIAAIVILLLVLAIGVFGFLISLPGGILGWTTSNLLDWTKYENNKFEVSQEDLKELCIYLEEMGVTDLEGYGFVEKIERGEPAFNEEGIQTSKGEITYVESKYLESYLVAEKKSFVLANSVVYSEHSARFANEWLTVLINALRDNNQNKLYDEIYNEKIFNIAIEETFNQYWAIGSNDQGIFKNAINAMYKLEDGKYVIIEELPKYSNSEFSQIEANELREKVKKMIVSYFQYKEHGTVEDNVSYEYGKELIQKEEDLEYRFRQTLNKIINIQEGKYSREDLIGTGLIYIEGANLNSKGDTATVDGYNVYIDEEKRLFILETEQIDDIWEQLFPALRSKLSYAYDLNNWTCKYGKPVEFLISMHLATGAPDFVYQVATSPAVDTKVHVDLFPVQMKLSLVTEDGGKQTINGILQQAEAEKIAKSSNIKTQIVYQLNKIVEQNKLLKEFCDPLKSELNNAFTNMDWLDMLDKLDYILGSANNQASQKNILEELGLVEEGEDKVAWREICSIINNAKKDKEGIYSSIIIKVNGVEHEFTRENYKVLKEQVEKYTESTFNNATPYITKVVNHWYRNQYFTAVDEQDLSSKKIRLRTLINNIFNHLVEVVELEGGQADSSLKEERNNAIDEIRSITTKEQVDKYLSDQKGIWEQKATSDELKTIIQNEFEAVSKEFESEVTGSAYEVQGNPEPFWQSLSESKDTFGDNSVVDTFMKKLYIKETRSADLVQVHNPVFEDNSQYIRNWLKEKYYIYETYKGPTDQEETAESTTTETLSDAKISQGKEYIQGKTALQIVTDMIEECKYERDDISYMLRDLQELFTDFEFDLENVEVPAQKMLDNVMPGYTPYTPWPSVYETAEDNCTKIIYKLTYDSTTEDRKIVAPANGIITKAEDNVLEIKFTSDDEKTSATTGMILHIEVEEGSLSDLPNVNTPYKRGDKIALANPNGDGMIILKLRLFSQTKQLLKVQNYMTIESKTYDNLTDEEKIYLYNLQETEIDIEKTWWFGDETQDTITARVALMNIVFNKIASPFYPQYASVEEMLSGAEKAKQADFLSYAENNGHERNKDLSKLESNNKQGKFAIMNALDGIDITKTYTLIGATRYFALEDEYYKQSKVDTETKEQKLNEAKNLIIQFQIGNRMLGITEDEYIAYLGDVLEKKINEVIYTLNLEKYTSGLQEYLEYLSQFESAKKEIIEYYTDGIFLIECGNGEDSESMKTITNVVKSNISQEREDIEGQEGKEKVIDKFTITVNSNYSTKWTFTYTKGAEGKIEGDIKVEHEAIRNY